MQACFVLREFLDVMPVVFYTRLRMETLSKLFGSASKVKVMRLFLFNPNVVFDKEDICKKTRVQTASARKVIRTLEQIGLIKKKKFVKKVKQSQGRGKAKKVVKKRVDGWVLDTDFTYLSALHKLLIGNEPFSHKEITERLSNAGNVKLILVSGLFLQEWETRLDILIVGDKLNKAAIAAAIRGMEAEIGKELTYATFSTKEFNYRMNVYDKLVRDVLDYPHEVVIDKINLGNRK